VQEEAFSIFHFPFLICHCKPEDVIANRKVLLQTGRCHCNRKTCGIIESSSPTSLKKHFPMTNEKWKMTNGKCLLLPPASAVCLLPTYRLHLPSALGRLIPGLVPGVV
jgi:hypothetical protein